MFEFTLLVEGPSFADGTVADELFAAGCGDDLLQETNGVQTIDFTREATTLQQAVLSAITDIESAGFRVVRAIDIDLLSMSAMAERLGRSRESIRLYARGNRGPGGFPSPVNRHQDGRYHLWRWTDVTSWLTQHGLAEADEQARQAAVLAAVNAALDLRSLGQILEPEGRADLRHLVHGWLAA